MVRSVNWWYIKQTYPETLIDIKTLLIPEGAYLEVIFSGLRIAYWVATVLSCQIYKTPDQKFLDITSLFILIPLKQNCTLEKKTRGL